MELKRQGQKAKGSCCGCLSKASNVSAEIVRIGGVARVDTFETK